jgi:hypothetical protein
MSKNIGDNYVWGTAPQGAGVPKTGVSSTFISKLGQIEKIFSSSDLTPSVKPLGLISTFASIGMFDLS